jgi:hypothetical protein
LKYASRSKNGFHTMTSEQALALSQRGTQALVDLANDYALTYGPYIRAAVREVGQNYRQVANWLTRERVPAPQRLIQRFMMLRTLTGFQRKRS